MSTSTFARDGTGRLLAATMQTGWKRPLVVAPDGTERRFDLPDIAGDLQPTDWHVDGRQVLLVASVRSATQLYRLDVEDGVVRRIDHPTGALAIGSSAAGAASFLADGRVLTTIEDGTMPPRVVALDAASGASETLIEAASGLSARPWRSLDIPSTDDTLVQAWLATPAGVAHSRRSSTSTEVRTHRKTIGTTAAAQAWLDRGYAVASVNYRGSIGFGRDCGNSAIGDSRDAASSTTSSRRVGCWSKAVSPTRQPSSRPAARTVAISRSWP